MQTTKFLFVIGAAAILTAPLQLTAGPDTEAQAKMREALRQKMEALNAPVAPAPVAPPAVVLAPAVPPQPVMEELKPMERPATVVVPVPIEPAPTALAPAPIKTSNQAMRFSEVPDAAAANTARMQEALRQQLAAERASAPAPLVVKAPAAPVPSAVPVFAPAPVVAQPIIANIETAPAPFSGSKQMRIAELLRRYKADEITPQDYHTQRATIVAEP